MSKIVSGNLKRDVRLARARGLQPLVRASVLWLASGTTGCSDDESTLALQTTAHIGVDAAADAGVTIGSVTGETGSSDTSNGVEPFETSGTTAAVTTPDVNTTSSLGSGETYVGATASSSVDVVPDSSTDTTRSTDELYSSTASETSTDVPDGGGDTGTQDIEPPVACGGADGGTPRVKAVATGALYTCAVLENGDVCCWGDNRYGQLGNASVASSAVGVKVAGISNVVALSAGGSTTCGLTETGEVFCWGNEFWSEEISFGVIPQRMVGLDDVKAIASGSSHACALTGGGQVYCWGDSSDGLLGNDALPPGKEPVLIEELEGIVAISTSGLAACAVRANGTVACWGSNRWGQLGDGSELVPGEYDNYSSSPVDVVGLSDVVGITASTAAFCALESNGSVWCWGGTDIESPPHATPLEVTGLGEVTSLTASSYTFCLTRPDRTAACWGENWAGQLGTGSFARSSTPLSVVGLSDVASLASSADSSHVCASRSDGTLACWGSNTYGQLGSGEFGLVGSSTPLQVAGDAVFVGVAAGVSHSCGLTEDEEVWCWGYDNETEQSEPVPRLIAGIEGAVAVDVANGVQCALRESGAVACWGNNDEGQLGDGTTESRNVPIDVPDLGGVVQVVTGLYGSVCAVIDDGTVKCWGSNGRGALATDPDAEDGVQFSSVPVAIANVADAIQVSVGALNTCALTTAGTVKCWGLHLVDGENLQARIEPPAVVDGLEGVTAISAGWDVTCALKSDKTVACWGRAYSSELGSVQPGDSLTVVPISGLTDVVQISAGADHICARRENGTVACWGSNQDGALGDGGPVIPFDYYGYGPRPQSATPIQVVGLTNVTNLDAGGGSTCATVATGETYCWGLNDSGQLGTGETPFSSVPVDVVWQ